MGTSFAEVFSVAGKGVDKALKQQTHDVNELQFQIIEAVAAAKEGGGSVATALVDAALDAVKQAWLFGYQTGIGLGFDTATAISDAAK